LSADALILYCSPWFKTKFTIPELSVNLVIFFELSVLLMTDNETSAIGSFFLETILKLILIFCADIAATIKHAANDTIIFFTTVN